MDGPPDAKDLQPFVLSDIQASNPDVRAVRKAWLKVNLKEERKGKAQELEDSNKRARLLEDQKDDLDHILLGSTSVIRTRKEELKKAEYRICELGSMLDKSLMDKKEIKLDFEAQIRDLRDALKKGEEKLSREILQKEEAERNCHHLRYQLEEATRRFAVLESQEVESQEYSLNVWKRSLNPLTWIEILRQVLVAAGFGSKQELNLGGTTEENSDSSSRVNAGHDPDPARYQTQQFQRKFTESMIHTEGINKSLQFVSLGFLDQIEIEHYDNANSKSCISRPASFLNIQKITAVFLRHSQTSPSCHACYTVNFATIDDKALALKLKNDSASSKMKNLTSQT
ncbi:hypothetical protein KIW84_030458 [Lathyrus oleraceus]|uniref:Uncharacterized protein n=1 Tax=Pisum sativum TaxID=3888 RepID=A0A9D4XSF3_PEA|nr:hypothetical protein KIW84_030458 [Pisum sativum]